MASANRFIREVYLRRTMRALPRLQRCRDGLCCRRPAQLRETLCVQEERIVARDNTVAYGGLRLQLPQSPLRAHYVKAHVRVHQYPDGGLAVFHSPRPSRAIQPRSLIETEPSKRAA